MLPSIIALIILFVKVMLYGNEVFMSPRETDSDFAMSAGSYMLNFIYVMLALWSIFFFVIGISEVQKLSIGKSILNLLTASLMFLLPIILLGGLLAVM